MSLVLGVFLSISSSSLLAVAQLPPLYQDLKELRSILVSDNLGQLLPAGDTIQDIRKVEDGYLIVTNNHRLMAKVIYKDGKIGPVPFTIEFQNPEPINK